MVTDMFSQQLINGLVLGSVYALFAMGFTLIFGVLEVLNLVYAFYFTVGAFLSMIGVVLLDLPLIIAAGGSCIMTGLIAAIVDTSLLGPLRRRNAPELSSLMVTMGGVLFLNTVMTLIFGPDIFRLPENTISNTSYYFGTVQINRVQVLIIGFTGILVGSLFYFIERTKTGTAIRAISENRSTAALMGVNINITYTLVSFISGFLGASAGILIGLNFNAIHVFMGEAIMLRGFSIIIIGGLGDIRGAMLAGLLLGFVEVLSIAYVSSSFKDAIAFTMLITVLMVRPSGLFVKNR